MIRYDQLKEKSKGFLAATGLTVAEFQRILPVFTEKLAGLHPPELPREVHLGNSELGLGPKRNCVRMKTN